MFDAIFKIGTLLTVLDIVVVAFLLYWFMLLFKGTRAERMLWGIGVIIIIYFVSQRFELLTLHWLLNNFLGSIAIFIIVVFQQDIRKALTQMGKPFSTRDVAGSREAIDEIVKAVISMSNAKTGGIIAVERGIGLSEFLELGVEVDAKASRELLLSIFNPASPLHDGAVAVRGGRVFKAGCILPLTGRELPKAMGTRHRAAVGLSEETDAVIIVVSEETGSVTLAFDDEVHTEVSPDELHERLSQLFEGRTGQKKSMLPWKA